MQRKSIEEKLSAEMDAYLNGIKVVNISKPEEYNEIFELGKKLAERDFSEESNSAAVFDRVKQNIDEYKDLNDVKGDNIMKKIYKIKRTAIAAASIALVCIIGVSILKPSVAEDVLNKVVSTITLGRITVAQEEPSKEELKALEEELKGKVFDKDGNPVKDFTQKSGDGLYTADGKKIVGYSNGKFQTETKEQSEKEKKEEKEQESKTFVVKNIQDINKYTCFKVILPSYLPEGYTFDRAEFYKDDNGIDKKYVDLYFVNEKTGKDIYIQQRLSCDETKYSMSAGSTEKIKINGVDAAVVDGDDIEWEANNVLYGLSGKISQGELTKIAESIK